MEPITVTSNLDLATYYKISMKILIKGRAMIVMLCLILFMTCLFIYEGANDLEDSLLFLSWIALYAVLLPTITWFRCKANMSKYPVLAEGTVYSITDEEIKNVSPSYSSSSKWTVISKAEENDKAIILYLKSYQIHYLPKNGFEHAGDIDRLKAIVKAKNIRSNF